MNDTSKEAHGIQQPSVRKRGRVDAVSLVGGLVFVAVAVTVLVGKYWVEVDAVLVVGGSTVAVGVAMIAGVILRGRRGEQEAPEGGPALGVQEGAPAGCDVL